MQVVLNVLQFLKKIAELINSYLAIFSWFSEWIDYGIKTFPKNKKRETTPLQEVEIIK